eukprot:6354789-Alexandrium_andersonii.AAC.1
MPVAPGEVALFGLVLRARPASAAREHPGVLYELSDNGSQRHPVGGGGDLGLAVISQHCANSRIRSRPTPSWTRPRYRPHQQTPRGCAELLPGNVAAFQQSSLKGVLVRPLPGAALRAAL